MQEMFKETGHVIFSDPYFIKALSDQLGIKFQWQSFWNLIIFNFGFCLKRLADTM